jgi:transposase-like zinc ribbon protein
MADLPQRFSDERICGEYLSALRWPGGFTCHCGSRHAVLLKARADTFECLDCGRQTSVTAGTLMHRTKLSLRQWFMAVQMFADRGGTVSAADLRRKLDISRTSAALLKSKLHGLADNAQQHVLDGPAVVLTGKMRLFADDECFLIAVREQYSGLIRARVIKYLYDNSIENFLLEIVRPGATIYFTNRKYPKLSKYNTKPAVGDQWRETFSFTKRIVDRAKKYLLDEVEYDVERYVANLNKRNGARPSFETLFRLIITKEPTSHWDMIDEENPRAGRPTVRRSVRRRKTVDGMRQDGQRRRSK